MSFISTVNKYCTVLHRWDSSISGGLAIDVVGNNNASIGSGIVQSPGLFQGSNFNYQNQVLPSVNSGLRCGNVSVLNNATSLTIMGISKINEKSGYNFLFDRVVDNNNRLRLFFYDATVYLMIVSGGVGVTITFSANNLRFGLGCEVFWAIVYNQSLSLIHI